MAQTMAAGYGEKKRVNRTYPVKTGILLIVTEIHGDGISVLFMTMKNYME